MHVREANAADAEAIRAVHRASITGLGPHAYADEQVEAWARGVEHADYGASITDDDLDVVVAEGEPVEGKADVATDDAGDDAPDADVLAFGSLSSSAPDGYEADVDAEVTGVYVHPDAARQGVGSAVLAELEQRAQVHGAGTLGLTSTLVAVPFYEAHGYERLRAYDHEFSAFLSTGVEGTVVEMAKDL